MCRRLQILSALTLLMLAITSARADGAVAREDQFKAAYLFNFVKFVEWPASAVSDAVTVCFLGGGGVYDALVQGIDGKRVGTRRLQARQLDDSATAEHCDALYLAAGSVTHLSMVEALPVLTISDAHEISVRGGMIELFTDRQRLRFMINAENAQRAGLRISSDLLKLAAGVRRLEH